LVNEPLPQILDGPDRSHEIAVVRQFSAQPQAVRQLALPMQRLRHQRFESLLPATESSDRLQQHPRLARAHPAARW
jgi:hypothetical protein